MDDRKKAKIRNAARITHWVTQLVLAGLLLFTYANIFEAHVEASRTDIAVFDAGIEFLGVNVRLWEEKTDRLAAFYPPTDAREWPQWTSSVQRYLEIPSAVFIRENASFQWTSVPNELLADTALAAATFSPTGLTATEISADTIGSLVRWTSTSRIGEKTAKLLAYIPLDGTLGWGVLSGGWFDYSFAMLAAMKRCTLMPYIERGPSLLADFIQVAKPTHKTIRPGMTVHYGDSLIYATPGVNLSHPHYETDLFGRKETFYNSDAYMETKRFEIAKAWFYFAIVGFFIILLRRYWSWIKRLTAPDAAAQ